MYLLVCTLNNVYFERIIYFYWEVRVKGKERQKEDIFHLLIHSQASATAEAEPVWNQEGVSFRSPMCIQGLKALG